MRQLTVTVRDCLAKGLPPWLELLLVGVLWLLWFL